MTCIVGLKNKGSVWIGADSAGVGGMTVDLRKDWKVFINGSFIMGFTDSFRMGQLLQYRLKLGLPSPEKSTFEIMVTDFIEAVRGCLRDGGFAKKVNEVEEGGEFLVGYRGRLFHIYSDYQVEEILDDYDACGWWHGTC